MIYFAEYIFELVDLRYGRYYFTIDKKMKDIISKTGVKYFCNYQFMLINGKPTYNFLYPDGTLKQYEIKVTTDSKFNLKKVDVDKKQVDLSKYNSKGNKPNRFARLDKHMIVLSYPDNGELLIKNLTSNK